MARDLLAPQLAAAAAAAAGRAALAGRKRGHKARPGAGASGARMAAARTFHDLLVLQSGGFVRLQQRADCADLLVRGGANRAPQAL